VEFPSPLVEGVLLQRYKRFLADVRLADGTEVTAHVANSGTMRSCSDPGSPVWLSPASNPKRKLQWTLEIIEVRGGVRLLVNTMLPNRIVREGIEQGWIPELAGYDGLRPEVRYGTNSRIDMLLEHDARPRCWVEVKNVTLLEEPGRARFPDAVTARGTKHLRELMGVVAAGERAVLVFHVPMGDAERVRPADDIDPLYGQTLREAAVAGVEVLAYRARVTLGGVRLERALAVDLDQHQ